MRFAVVYVGGSCRELVPSFPCKGNPLCRRSGMGMTLSFFFFFFFPVVNTGDDRVKSTSFSLQITDYNLIAFIISRHE